jgi:hypothetical protein
MQMHQKVQKISKLAQVQVGFGSVTLQTKT